MGKRIISQARGKGSLSYRVRKQAFAYRISYPKEKGQATILKLIHSPAHSAPIIKAQLGREIFYNVAFEGALEGQKIAIGQGNEKGNIAMLKDIPLGTSIFNIE